MHLLWTSYAVLWLTEGDGASCGIEALSNVDRTILRATFSKGSYVMRDRQVRDRTRALQNK